MKEQAEKLKSKTLDILDQIKEKKTDFIHEIIIDIINKSKTIDRHDIGSFIRKNFLPSSFDPDREWNILKENFLQRYESHQMYIQDFEMKRIYRVEALIKEKKLRRLGRQKTKKIAAIEKAKQD